ncbi:LOW QUALITY PROTEIN: UDP-glucuronosyltransferase 3A1-like [Odontesthes bonariensis]
MKLKKVADDQLNSGLPPGGLTELHHEAELWALSAELPQHLMPYTVLVGDLFNKPAKPLEQFTLGSFSSQQHINLSLILQAILTDSHNPKLAILQDFDLWICSFAESGFIVVTLGPVVTSVSVDPLQVEKRAEFRCGCSGG